MLFDSVIKNKLFKKKKKKLNKIFEAGLKFSLIYFLNNKMLNFYL